MLENNLVFILKVPIRDRTITEGDILSNYHFTDINLNLLDNKNKNSLDYAIELNWMRVAQMILDHPRKIIHSEDRSRDKVDEETLRILCQNKHYVFLGKMLAKGFACRDHELVCDLWELYEKEGDPDLLKVIRQHAPRLGGLFRGVYDLPVNPLSARLEREKSWYGIRHGHNAEDKKSTIKRVFINFSHLVSDKYLCLQLLKTFDSFLQEAWVKELPETDAANVLDYFYSTKRYASCDWPIPIENNFLTNRVRRFSKNGFLQRQCVAFLKKLGYEGEFYKFFGFVKSAQFEEAIKKWDLFTESSLNPNFLTHGKNIHIIGRILFILAWQSEEMEFDKTYYEDRVENELTLKEVFEQMFNPDYEPKYIGDKTTWEWLCDTGSLREWNACDPFVLHATLMNAAELPILSLLMRHSFCKALYRMREFIQDTTKEKWTIEEIWDCYVSPRTPYTISCNLPQVVTWLRQKKKLSAEDAADLSQGNPARKHRFSKCLP